MLNLCINARDATGPGGGRLAIRTANEWVDARLAAERELLQGQYITITVIDTGSGMSPEVQSRMFARHERVDKAFAMEALASKVRTMIDG